MSEIDADRMRKDYRPRRADAIPTGVDLEYFAPRATPRSSDLVFLGSMDWMPNIDGAEWFVREVLPLIRKRKPDCSVVHCRSHTHARRVGSCECGHGHSSDRNCARCSAVPVGSNGVDRPFEDRRGHSLEDLSNRWRQAFRLFRPLLARRDCRSSLESQILIADDPASFAECCLRLMEDPVARARMAEEARQMVASRFSWEAVVGASLSGSWSNETPADSGRRRGSDCFIWRAGPLSRAHTLTMSQITCTRCRWAGSLMPSIRLACHCPNSDHWIRPG